MSPYFFNAGLFNTGRAIAALGRHYARDRRAVRCRIRHAVRAGLQGHPAGDGDGRSARGARRTSTALTHSIARKPRTTAKAASIVGAPLAGRVLIVDDVITAGTAIRESVDIIRRHGATPGGRADRARPRGARQRANARPCRRSRQTFGLPVVSVLKLATWRITSRPPARRLRWRRVRAVPGPLRRLDAGHKAGGAGLLRGRAATRRIAAQLAVPPPSRQAVSDVATNRDLALSSRGSSRCVRSPSRRRGWPRPRRARAAPEQGGRLSLQGCERTTLITGRAFRPSAWTSTSRCSTTPAGSCARSKAGSRCRRTQQRTGRGRRAEGGGERRSAARPDAARHLPDGRGHRAAARPAARAARRRRRTSRRSTSSTCRNARSRLIADVPSVPALRRSPNAPAGAGPRRRGNGQHGERPAGLPAKSSRRTRASRRACATSSIATSPASRNSRESTTSRSCRTRRRRARSRRRPRRPRARPARPARRRSARGARPA